jgi:hypothetical protein
LRGKGGSGSRKRGNGTRLPYSSGAREGQKANIKRKSVKSVEKVQNLSFEDPAIIVAAVSVVRSGEVNGKEQFPKNLKSEQVIIS